MPLVICEIARVMKETLLAGSLANGPYKNRWMGTDIHTHRVARGDHGHCAVMAVLLPLGTEGRPQRVVDVELAPPL